MADATPHATPTVAPRPIHCAMRASAFARDFMFELAYV
ncbi:hypothetical protein AKJ09_04957 [Labilithrix luteola]|uniref:Uncharacterized protein n=1 Tax=Labilithrix luteola TaxID=1391654 RepID=A0A0K1PXP6_9BACT|nr:hypothetical protein AKJ09_04957 [Labilithrix luteola]